MLDLLILGAALILPLPKVNRLLHSQPALGGGVQQTGEVHGHVSGKGALLVDGL